MNFWPRLLPFCLLGIGTVTLVIDVILLKSRWSTKLLIAAFVYGFWVDEFHIASLDSEIASLNKKIAILKYSSVCLNDEVVKLKSELKKK